MKRRLALIAIALILILASWWQVTAPARGLTVRRLTQDGMPLLYLAPPRAERVPAVLIAHGFAGSKQLMLGYGYVLAQAGYAALLWDFGGHGANGGPLARTGLQADVDRAYATLVAQPEVDPGRVAIVGHSMGSGAAMAAGIRDANRYAATVAISPTGAEVTPLAPRNLLLQAGSWEGRFVANATGLLQAAGGPGEDFAAGRARQLIVIPNAEHISILFRNESHRAVLDWVNRAFGQQRTTPYVDRRILWYLLHLAGWLLVILAAGPTIRPKAAAALPPLGWRPWLGLALAALASSLALGLLNRVTPLQTLGGILVGGAVGLWFLFAGLGWLLPAGRRKRRPTGADLAWGGLLFVLFSLAFGAMAQAVWVQWWLIPARLVRWPVLALLCLPWCLAAGLVQARARGWQRLLWWAGQSVALLAGLYLALLLAPSLGFLILLMPLLPVLLAILALAGAAVDRAWAYGIGGALFLGWVIAAVFPLA